MSKSTTCFPSPGSLNFSELSQKCPGSSEKLSLDYGRRILCPEARVARTSWKTSVMQSVSASISPFMENGMTNLKKALARRLLGKRKGCRIVTDKTGCRLVRGTDIMGSLSWSDVPDPLWVVTRVMRMYRGYESSVASIPCLNGEQMGMGPASMEDKLSYIGKVNKVLSGLRNTDEKLIRLFHPANGDITRPMIADRTGVPVGSVGRYYNRAVVGAAAGFIRKGLFDGTG